MYNIIGEFMKRVIAYIENGLTNKIDLSKLGIMIRNLNDIEYNEILSAYKSIILNEKDKNLAKQYFDYKNKKRNFSKEEKNNLFTEIDKSKNSHIILNVYNAYNKKEIFNILKLDNIKKELKNFVIIEINMEEFTKQFSQNYYKVLIPEIFSFSNYVSSCDKEYNDYNNIWTYEYDEFIKLDKSSQYQMIIILLFNRRTKVNETILIKLQKMFNLKDRSFCFNFLMIIDNVLEERVLIENRIINKVSYLERLLISKEENKADAFVLKVGILCHQLFDISNQELSKQLKEIYNIRSMLVHGEESKIIDNIDYYKKIFCNVIEKKHSKHETRKQILITVDSTLELFFIRVLNKYLDEPNLCEYIKQN